MHANRLFLMKERRENLKKETVLESSSEEVTVRESEPVLSEEVSRLPYETSELDVPLDDQMEEEVDSYYRRRAQDKGKNMVTDKEGKTQIWCSIPIMDISTKSSTRDTHNISPELCASPDVRSKYNLRSSSKIQKMPSINTVEADSFSGRITTQSETVFDSNKIIKKMLEVLVPQQ